MHIVACIKEVPVGKISMDEKTGTLRREVSGNSINDNDLVALEAAIRIKEQTGAIITAITMGPKHAQEVIRLALAMGADQGVLMSDREFSGADVYATAYTLTKGIELLQPVDLVICGQQTTDGDTAQVPFSLGVQMGSPIVGWIKEIKSVGMDSISIVQEMTGGRREVKVSTPCVLAVAKDAFIPRIPTLPQRLRAKKAELTLLTLEDLKDKDKTHYGLNASPTKVKKIFIPSISKKSEPIELSPEEAMKVIKEVMLCQY